MIRERLRSVLSEAIHNKITPDEVRGLVESELARLAETPTETGGVS